MNKYINNQGLVGVVLSNSNSNHGIGWSSYYKNKSISTELLFDAELVELVLDQWDDNEIDSYCYKQYYGKYTRPPGFFDLRVEFIPPDKTFTIIHDSHGEWILFFDDMLVYNS